MRFIPIDTLDTADPTTDRVLSEATESRGERERSSCLGESSRTEKSWRDVCDFGGGDATLS